MSLIAASFQFIWRWRVWGWHFYDYKTSLVPIYRWSLCLGPIEIRRLVPGAIWEERRGV